MIINNDLFNRIKELRELYEGEYQYILLGFFKDKKVEIFFTDTRLEIIKHFSSIVPLLLIYDKERFEKNKQSNVSDILLNTLTRIDDWKKSLIGDLLKDISYDYFISNKEDIIKTIDNVMKTINIIKTFENSLDEDFLTKDDIKKLQSMNEKLQDIEDDVKKGIQEVKILYKESNLKKKNIKKIIKKNNYLFLNLFFFTEYGTNKEDLLINNNNYSSEDIKTIVNLMIENNETPSTDNRFYKETLNEIEYCNLYHYDIPLCEDRYFELHSKLYSSHKKNRITKLSKTFIDEDIFKNMTIGIGYGFRDYVYQRFTDKYNISFDDYSYEELLDNKDIDNDSIDIMREIFKEFYSEEIHTVEDGEVVSVKKINKVNSSQRILIFASRIYQEYLEIEISKFSDEYLYEYIENLHIGEEKHRKS